MNPGGLVVVAAAAHLAPLHIASLLQDSHAAWEYVMFGLEAMFLWLAVASATTVFAIQAAAIWGATEGAMRATCRLAFPMDKPPPKIPGANLCDIATGQPASLLTLILAAAVVVVIDTTRRR